MTVPFQDFDELHGLIEALCEETIRPDQMQRLEQLVLTHPEAEAYYIQYMNLVAELAQHFGRLPIPTEESLRDRIAQARQGVNPEQPASALEASPVVLHARRPRRFVLWGSLGVAGLAAGLLLALYVPRPSLPTVAPSADAKAEPLDTSVAVLLQASGAVWEETELPTRVGAPLSPGRLRLKSGFVHIEFTSGAMVILEGPADFHLISRMEAYCAHGKLRATVPPQAQGFTIGSPNLDLVDRGTEFGLHVGADDRTEVHVFQGKVELYDAGSVRAGGTHKELKTGQGLRLDGPGTVSPIELNPAAFLTAQDLAVRSRAETRRRQRDWLAESEILRKDPDMVVYYSFQAEHSWSRSLPDEAQGRQHVDEGAIVGCSWVTGRWPGKQGLEFKRVSDRVRLHLGRDFDSLTLMAWVRIDALPNRFNSLFMTDSWDDGGPHWHISETGKLELGVQGPNRKGGVHYYTPEVITPERFGQWTHLAVAYDADAHQVTHYVDGQPVMQEEIKLDIPLHIGDAEIGNWHVGTRRHNHPIRNLSGCMDEFMLFSRALADHEIEQLYDQGRPPS